jgi:D-glycero-D-manno-heptose 1,7-bisphosphate phosphatase
MKLVILDRDGVINEDSDDYIKSPDEFIPLPGALAAIAQLKQANYTVVVATNQSGIARRMFDVGTLNAIHAKLQRELRRYGVSLDAIVFCPHGPEDACECRKPKPGLLREVGARLQVDLCGVPVIGDTLRDIEAAREVDALPVLVRTGKGERTLAMHVNELKDVPVYADLAAAVAALLAGELHA